MFEKLNTKRNAFKTKQRQRFRTFLDNNIKETEGLTKIEKFCAKNFIFIAKNWNDYCDGDLSKTRTRISLTLKAIIFVVLLKMVVPSISPNDLYIRAIFSDGTYLLGDNQLILILCAIGSIVTLITGLLYVYFELKGRLFVVKFLNDIKYKRNILRLSQRNSNKFCLRLNLINNYAIDQVYKLLSIVSTTILSGTSVIVYLQTGSTNLPCLIFWLVNLVIYFLHFWQLLLGGIVIWYIFLIYLKYQFIEINELFENSLKNKNTNSLLNAILRHKSVEQTVHELNKMYKILVLIFYLAAVPVFDLAIFIPSRRDSSIILMCFSSSLGLAALISMFALNYTCAQIVKTAHKSRPLLYIFLIESKLSIHHKWKIHEFIEHLSGAEIGFYCLTLFPMNFSTFFDFIVAAFKNYFLLVKIF